MNRLGWFSLVSSISRMMRKLWEWPFIQTNWLILMWWVKNPSTTKSVCNCFYNLSSPTLLFLKFGLILTCITSNEPIYSIFVFFKLETSICILSKIGHNTKKSWETGICILSKIGHITKKIWLWVYLSASVESTDRLSYSSASDNHCVVCTTDFPCKNGYETMQQKLVFTVHKNLC